MKSARSLIRCKQITRCGLDYNPSTLLERQCYDLRRSHTSVRKRGSPLLNVRRGLRQLRASPSDAAREQERDHLAQPSRHHSPIERGYRSTVTVYNIHQSGPSTVRARYHGGVDPGMIEEPSLLMDATLDAGDNAAPQDPPGHLAIQANQDHSETPAEQLASSPFPKRCRLFRPSDQ